MEIELIHTSTLTSIWNIIDNHKESQAIYEDINRVYKEKLHNLTEKEAEEILHQLDPEAYHCLKFNKYVENHPRCFILNVKKPIVCLGIHHKITQYIRNESGFGLNEQFPEKEFMECVFILEPDTKRKDILLQEVYGPERALADLKCRVLELRNWQEAIEQFEEFVSSKL